MNGSLAKYWILLAGLLAAIYGSFAAWRYYQPEAPAHGVATGAPAETAGTPRQKPLQEFVLTDQSGQAFDSNSLRGKVWVGSFFFTNCPSACWKLNQALAALQQTNPASDVRYVSFTCDPESDTPETLTKYAQNFHADPARWTFVTGDFKLIKRIGNDFFQVGLDKQTHSDRAFVVDRQGQVRGRFRLTEPDQVEMLRKLLAQIEAEPEKVSSG